MSEPITGPRSGYTYAASPYSHPNPAVRLTRRLLAEDFAYYLITQGRPTYAPLTMGWCLAARHQLPEDAEFWAPLNMAMINAASCLAVLCLPGWAESKGVALELRFAADLGLPVEFWAYEEAPQTIGEPHVPGRFIRLEAAPLEAAA
jgi:hypothetical protein